jgi:hypothetical protein
MARFDLYPGQPRNFPDYAVDVRYLIMGGTLKFDAPNGAMFLRQRVTLLPSPITHPARVVHRIIVSGAATWRITSPLGRTCWDR